MKGAIRQTPIYQDEYDRAAQARTRRIFRGRPNDPRRSTYQKLYAGMLRTEARCRLRGWFDSRGEQKQAATQYYGLVDRVSVIERDLSREDTGGEIGTVEQARAQINALATRFPDALVNVATFADGTLIAAASDVTSAPPLNDSALTIPDGLPAAPIAPEPTFPREGPVVEGTASVTAGRVKREQAVIAGAISQRAEAERKRREAFFRGDDLED